MSAAPNMKKASLETPPRARKVAVVRYRNAWQRTMQRHVSLSVQAAHDKADKVRAHGGEALVYVASIGAWTEATYE